MRKMEQKTPKNYKELIVWQRAMELIKAIYELTEDFPKTETYGITTQMRRAVISIASNIAEGSRRGSRKDFRHFLINAFGSGAELETQIEIGRMLSFGQEAKYGKTEKLLEEVMRMLNRMIGNLQLSS